MSNSDDSQEFKIHIVSDADNSGFKSAAGACGELGSANTKTAEVTGDLSKKQEEGAEQANILHKNHRLVHQVLRLIAHESGPAAAAALGAIGAAAGGGMLLAVMAVRELFNWIHELNKKSQEWRELMESQIDLSSIVREVGTVISATDTAKQKTAEFFDAINRKANESDGWKKITDDQIEQLGRVAEAQKKLADAEADRDKAKLDFLKASKQISAEQYAQGMAAVEAMRQNKKDESDSDLSGKSIGVLQNALANIDLQRHINDKSLEPANIKSEEAKKAVESLKARLETAQKLYEAHLEKLTGGKDGKGGLLSKMDEISEEVMKVAELSDAERHKMFEDERTKPFGQHSPDFWDKVKKARELMEKIRDERQDEVGAAKTRSRIREALPGAEVGATAAETEAKAIQEKINQLATDKKAIEAELKKRAGTDAARATTANEIAAAQTIAEAYKSETVRQPGGDNSHLRPLDEAKYQLAENQKVGQALATAASQAAREHSTLFDIILRALADISAQNKILGTEINRLSRASAMPANF